MPTKYAEAYFYAHFHVVLILLWFLKYSQTQIHLKIPYLSSAKILWHW